MAGAKASTSKYKAALIPGDGIGPEVIGAARRVIEAVGVHVDWVECAAGYTALERFGSVLPEETIETVRRLGLALKGPCGTPIGGGHKSVNVELRQKLNLYAAVRPVRSLQGVKTRYDNVEMIIIRENTEGLYSGIEHEVVPGVVEALKIVTEKS